MRALLVAAGAVVVAVVLFFVLRPDDDERATTTTATTATTATSTPTTTVRRPTVTRVGIVVRDDRVRGGLRRLTLDQGRRVELVVMADVSDEVHLHGYDRTADVAPGRPARLRFTANTPGEFEVELESRHFQIAEITVRP